MKEFIVDASDGKSYGFVAETPYNAIKNMVYYLSITNQETKESIINKTETGNYLWFEFNEIVYAVKNN